MRFMLHASAAQRLCASALWGVVVRPLDLTVSRLEERSVAWKEHCVLASLIRLRRTAARLHR